MNANGNTNSSSFEFFFKKLAPLMSKLFFKKITSVLSSYKDNFSLLHHQRELSEDPLGKCLITIDFEEKTREEKMEEYLEQQKTLMNSIIGEKSTNAFENTIQFLTFFKK
jgi:hypothetical protein